MIAPSSVDWRARLLREQRCTAELHPRAAWVRRIDASGTHLQFFCDECDRPVTRDRYPQLPGASVTADWLRDAHGIDAALLPEHRRGVRYHLCYLCGATSLCEFHHVAPQAIYGDAADKYPIVPLCPECHQAETREFTARLEAYVQRRVAKALGRRTRERPRAGEVPDAVV